MNKRGLSPLIATILLVVFALIIGAMVMTWAENPSNFSDEREEQPKVVFGYDMIDNELKDAQLDYILGRMTLEEYLSEEKEILDRMGIN